MTYSVRTQPIWENVGMMPNVRPVWRIESGPLQVRVHGLSNAPEDEHFVSSDAVGLDCERIGKGMTEDEAKREALRVVYNRAAELLAAAREIYEGMESE